MSMTAAHVTTPVDAARLACALALAVTLQAEAQVSCVMPNGTTIHLQNANACPSGGRKLDSSPPPRLDSPIKGPAHMAPQPTRKLTPPPTPSRPPGAMTISKEFVFGCRQREQLSRLASIASSGDRDAFKKGLAISFLRAECTPLKKGSLVYIEDTAMFSGVMQVRPHGAIESYWIPMGSAD